ncbi:MAG: KamA family radical SAM protein [Lentisphaerae bacterium RIFOXYB12_FULL_65_16]|nr:MAG: KamA family radical SAM protein [Lentisphaerae bacterium RIFOXYA12_64_32]OGV87558.1 MAG: KamA family radical SAM protein [Lentisphaerae bacterium RIFOXYB12_FULL_65_16]
MFGDLLSPWLVSCESLDDVRRQLYAVVSKLQYESAADAVHDSRFVVMRDCARALRGMLSARSEALAKFSVTQAIWDVVRGLGRPDLQPAFFADVSHLLLGILGQAKIEVLSNDVTVAGLQGREAALARSDELDRLWGTVEARLNRYPDGMSPDAVARRQARRQHILATLHGSDADWQDWNWQNRHIIRDAETLARLVCLRDDERQAVQCACEAKVPFGITPYYASLMDDDPAAGRDRAVRMQVLPPLDYAERMAGSTDDRAVVCDFMREHDTSPIDLVTRRYPAVAILKPFNTCPQICVYCQRNWEIEAPMMPNALAHRDQIEAACAWLEQHPAIREVLVTGGDPLAMPDADLAWVLNRIAAIPHVDMIRIGTRVPVTLPMRITPDLAAFLGSLRQPGRREVCVVTHVEHVYEITPDLVTAVDLLRRQGIALYNQLVYTFYVSRRFEAAGLRLLLRRSGIDPYYTFVPKGKEETRAYRVPLARILQEQKEEARLLPGSRRTDEPVYNLPGLGKNHLRAIQHRDLISILPDGSRLYEFHPWEKNIAQRDSYVGADVPILEYLTRLTESGEQAADYDSVWYYF